MDFYTCGDHTDPWAACEYAAKILGATSMLTTEVKRGIESSPTGRFTHVGDHRHDVTASSAKTKAATGGVCYPRACSRRRRYSRMASARLRRQWSRLRIANRHVAMPKTEHYQWYVEQFADTELHHHAIEELYYAGTTPFQSVAVLRTAVVRQDARSRRRHAEFAGRREDLSRVARASGARRVARSQRGTDSRRRRGRDTARGAAPSRRQALHDGRHRRRRGRALEEISCRNGRPARSTIRART